MEGRTHCRLIYSEITQHPTGIKCARRVWRFNTLLDLRCSNTLRKGAQP